MALISTAHAETPDEILGKVRAANHVDGSIETMTMTIYPKSGSPQNRQAELRTRRDGDTTKTYLKVLSPSDQAGTQLLQIDAPGTANDQQMVYLPAFKKVNLISGASQKGAFLGSDFTFEDLKLRDSAMGGASTLVEDAADHWTLETTLTGGSYAKIRTTIGKADLVLHKVEFYDANGVVKVLEVKKFEKDGNFNIPVETEMTTVAKGTHTTLAITSHKLNPSKTELPDDTFTQAYLQRK
jgi:outer membrane lipoprotein-sorting protein